MGQLSSQPVVGVGVGGVVVPEKVHISFVSGDFKKSIFKFPYYLKSKWCIPEKTTLLKNFMKGF